jgi:hypothetical protein
MLAHKIKVTITANHQLSFRVPDDFPAGPAEIVILANSSTNQQIVKLAGVLAPDISPPKDIDPIFDSLQELRRERERRSKHELYF